ncbi:MAG: carbohydrate kinase family protein [Candidatus Dormibacterales bacterium]
MDLLCSIGDLLQDVVVAPARPFLPDDDNPARIRIGPGGQAANFCAWAAHLGAPARLLTKVGDDEAGERLAAHLARRGVDVRAARGEVPTGIIVVLLGGPRERTLFTQRGASVTLAPDEVLEEWMAGVRHLHVPAYTLFLEPAASSTRRAVALARRGGASLSVDLSSAAGIRERGPAELAQELSKLHPEVVFGTAAEQEALGLALGEVAGTGVVKLGEEGCEVGGARLPAPPPRGADATGAGDAFAAAYCVATLGGAMPQEAARRGLEAAAQALGTSGAQP